MSLCESLLLFLAPCPPPFPLSPPPEKVGGCRIWGRAGRVSGKKHQKPELCSVVPTGLGVVAVVLRTQPRLWAATAASSDGPAG